MRENRFLEQSAKAENLHQASERFRFGRMSINSIEETDHGLRGPSHIDLDQRIKLMRNGEVGIKSKGPLKGGLRQLRSAHRPPAKLIQEPAAAAEPSPRGWEVWIFGKSGPVKIARHLHGL